VAAEVLGWGSVWSTENGSWGQDWMQWRDGVLLGALCRAGTASRGGGGEESVAASGIEWSVVLSLESAPRGRGNGGVVKLQKGKWRQRGSGAEAALGVTAASRMGSGGAPSDRRTEMKEERAEWAAKARWGG
jgi:hypothetical protein